MTEKANGKKHSAAVNSDATPEKPVTRTCFSLCHQSCIRIYGGSPTFCAWITQLLQQLWIAGVFYEKRITLAAVEHRSPPFIEEEVGSENGDVRQGVELEYSEVKLNGAPWCIPEWNKDNLMAVQYMMARFAGVLALVGWKCRAAVNVYSSPYDKGLLIFEKELVSYSPLRP